MGEAAPAALSAASAVASAGVFSGASAGASSGASSGCRSSGSFSGGCFCAGFPPSQSRSSWTVWARLVPVMARTMSSRWPVTYSAATTIANSIAIDDAAIRKFIQNCDFLRRFGAGGGNGPDELPETGAFGLPSVTSSSRRWPQKRQYRAVFGTSRPHLGQSILPTSFCVLFVCSCGMGAGQLMREESNSATGRTFDSSTSSCG